MQFICCMGECNIDEAGVLYGHIQTQHPKWLYCNHHGSYESNHCEASAGIDTICSQSDRHIFELQYDSHQSQIAKVGSLVYPDGSQEELL